VSATVDIVVPVYRGEAETRACLESVLASAGRVAFEVVVIDDASPEPAISAWLRSLADAGRITLVAHADNRGFVASVNEGMALHADRDVVLLNSDTEVARGWLDRLTAHASADRAIGTATPFSSNATICSYPVTLVANAIPAGETTASLDDAFAHANAGLAVDIPTGVGFCMHITRRCLERIGPFDEARYGRGYGEEVDFCMRAARAGFRNVIAGDVFVRHVGEVSFGDAGLERRREAQALVDSLYPEFQPALREFLAADPVRALRHRADLERLKRSRRPLELVIAAADATAPEASPGHETLMLRVGSDGGSVLRWVRPGEGLALEGDTVAIGAALRGLAIEKVSLGGAPALPAEVAGVPAVHDALQAANARELVEGLRARANAPRGLLGRLKAWMRARRGGPA
jgi:GT2 family glycosyltransferase